MPSPPRDLKPNDVHETVKLTWAPPEKDGGSPIVNYNVEWRDAKNKAWTACTPTTECSITIEGLTYDHEYVFRVNATNEVGPSDWTTTKPVKSTCPFKPPGPPPPPEPAFNDTDGSVTVTWQPPSDDGGSPITGYVVEQRTAKATKWKQVSPQELAETMLQLSKVPQDEEYSFRVAAVNKAGQGPFSEPSKPLIVKKKGIVLHKSLPYMSNEYVCLLMSIERAIHRARHSTWYLSCYVIICHVISM